jgi:hypothetical protein
MLMPDTFIAVPISFSGRTFTPSELQLIRRIVSDYASLGIQELAATVCELLAWQRPNGQLKSYEGRRLLERLQQQGLLQLPALRQRGPKGPQRVVPTSASDPQPELHGSVGQFAPLVLERVAPDSQASRLWRELVARYHYLGYRVPVGANLRYLVRPLRCCQPVLACLLWSSPAWKMAVRDRWIGWSPEQRAANLPWIVNNSRFLILPWVRVRGLASQILSRCARRLATPLWLSAAAAGDAGRCQPLRRHLLPGRQLDPLRSDDGPRPYGSHSSSSRSSPQTGFCLSPRPSGAAVSVDGYPATVVPTDQGAD